MKEDLLHYLWNFRKFRMTGLRTVDGKMIHILDPGQHNTDSGPDFFNGKIRIDRQTWAGNIELHLKSSDWFHHGHQTDHAYDNVILHVVWKYDRAVKRHDGSIIPTLELRNYVSNRLLEKYRELAISYLSWIPCEQDLARVGNLTLTNMFERCFLERLEARTEGIYKELKSVHGDWETLLFRMIARAFGAKVNGDAFYSMASSFPFSLVRKYRYDPEALEAMLMGQAGLLAGHSSDSHFIKMKEMFGYLKLKHGLDNQHVVFPKFFRIRPSGFPTIRLSQLAVLYSKQQHMFARAMVANTAEELYQLFNVQTLRYWETHYRFGTPVRRSARQLSKAFIDLIVINTVIPVRFAYEMSLGLGTADQLIDLISGLNPESNSVIRKFRELGVDAKNAFESQALLELKGSYCERRKCLSCKVGNALLSGKLSVLKGNNMVLKTAE